nr:ribonuclease H-like domain-containing protein [Tanacetum cinerariifolium]
MDSLSPQVVSAAKLPILNPNEFDLWKMRIEQYFLMTDYSLWEVILNGDSPAPTRVVKGVLQPVAPTTAEQKLAKKNELKARGTLLMTLPDKHQLKFNSHKGANTLMEAIEKSSESLDQIHDRLQKLVSQLEIHGVSISQEDVNLKECRSPKDSRRNGVAEPQRRTVQIETSTSNALVSQCDGVGSCDWSFQAEEEPANYALMAFSSSSSSSDNEAPQFVPSFIQSTKQVKSPRHFIQHVETSIPAATPKPTSPKPASSGKRRNRKACFVCKSLEHLIKDCNCHAKKIAQPITRNRAHKVSAIVPQIKVTRPKQVQPIVTKPKSPIKRHITRSPSPKTSNSTPRVTAVKAPMGNPQHALKDKGVIDSGYSRNMTRNMSYLFDFEELNGGYVAFRVNLKGGKIYGKGKIRTGKLDFDDVYFVKELKFNLFSVSQMCDKKNSVLFTNIEYLVLNPDFKLPDYSQLCGIEGIKREFSAPRTLQQNGIAEKKNRTLIEAARIMLADSLLPIPFWAKAVNTTCYVQNRVLVTKPHNKTPYELLRGRTPSIGFMRPFSCPVTLLNTLDSLGKFDGKVDEGFLVGYYPNVAGSGPTWLFDIDSLTMTMNYQPVTTVNQTNPSAGFHDKFAAEKAGEEIDQQYVIFLVWSSGSINPQNIDGDATFDGKEPKFNEKKPESKVNVSPSSSAQSRKQDDKTNTNTFSAASLSNATASPTHGKSSSIDASQLPDDPDMPELEDITYFDVGAEADLNNLETSITVSPIPTTRFHKDHPVSQIIGGTQEGIKRIKEAVAQGHTQEEGINYEEVFAAVARIEAIILFLAYASFMGLMLYQMDVKSTFLYGTIKEEVYVCQPSGFEDPDHLDNVYKVVKALYGLHQAPRACQYKYVAEILRKFGLTEEKLASTPIDIEKPLLKDPDGEDVDVHTYRLMIGSLMYLTSSRPDILFAVNDVTRLQALVDKKKVVVTEATIREALRLDDEKGVDCMPNEEIFAELARMGYEKPSTKLTFYKAFFSSHLVRNVDSPTKFYMYLCFLQLIIRKQVGDLSTHTTKYTSPALTQKWDEEERDADDNVDEVNAGDAAEGDVSATHGEVSTVAKEQSISSPTPPIPPPQPPQDIPSTSQHLEFNKVAQALEITKLKRRVKKLERRNTVRKLKFKRLQRVGTSQRVETSDETVLDDVSNQGMMIAEMDQDDAVVIEDDKEEDREVADAIKDVEEAKVDEIPAATLTAAPARVTVAPSRRRKGVVIKDAELESTTSTIILDETKSKDKGILVEDPKPLKKKQHIEQDEQYARELHAELNKDIDWDEVIEHVKLKAKEDPAVKKYQAMKRNPQTEAQARKNMMLYLKNVAGSKMDYFKKMSYDGIHPIFEAKFNSNVDFLLKKKEQIEENKNRALQKLNETLAERAAK